MDRIQDTGNRMTKQIRETFMTQCRILNSYDQ